MFSVRNKVIYLNSYKLKFKKMKAIKNLKNNALVVLLTLFSIAGFSQNAGGKIYLSVTHDVADYTKWKAGFDEHMPVRMEAGLKDIFVKRDLNNTNSVTVFFEVSDLEKAKAFISSPNLKETMTKVGVISAPVIVFYKSAEEFTAINTSALVTTISHSVKDYAAWKPVYDSAEELRKSAGIHDNLILRSLSDENMITVLGNSSSAAKFNEFMSNPGLKTAMDKAGVISKPEVKVLL
jgi:hypothetical protein